MSMKLCLVPPPPPPHTPLHQKKTRVTNMPPHGLKVAPRSKIWYNYN